jgi:hypothetical protein
MDRMKLRDKPMTADEVLNFLRENEAESRRENEELGIPDRAPGLNPIYAVADQQPSDGGLNFTVSMTGENLGGPAQLPVRLTADDLCDPFRVFNVFNKRVLALLRVMSARFAGSLPD